MRAIMFNEVVNLAAQGAEIGPCGEIYHEGKVVGYPSDDVNSEVSGFLCPLQGVRAAREVYELNQKGEPTGRSVWLPCNF